MVDLFISAWSCVMVAGAELVACGEPPELKPDDRCLNRLLYGERPTVGADGLRGEDTMGLVLRLMLGLKRYKPI